MTAQTPAQRQQAFKASQREAGMVRLDIWLTKEQRDRLTALGGVTWLRKKIDASRPPQRPGSPMTRKEMK